jgi:nucleotide-binding universal stress UspA family protein
MSSILIPLDGSHLAAQVLPYARSLAELTHASLLLAHVIPHAGHLHVGTERGLLDKLEGRTCDKADIADLTAHREQATRYLEAQAARLREDGLVVGTTVLEGRPDEVIAAAAADVDMVAMSTHGYSGLRRWALGSVTDRVLHTSPKPVLVVRSVAEQPFNLRRILVPLDGSALARRALPAATDLARAAQAELIVMSVMPAPLGGVEGAITPVIFTPQDQALLRDRLMGEALTVGGIEDLKISTRIAQGYVAEEVSDEAQRSAVDLIVISTHGYGGWRRLALGSVTDKVLHVTKTPVLVVPAQDG